MTQEDKELLLKYLCAALPYGLIVRLDNGGDYKTRDLKVKGLSESNDLSGINSIICYLDNELVKFNIKEARPYLRSMSSMTEEEKEELLNLLFDKEAKYFYIDEEGLIDGRKFNLFKEGINYPSFCPINILLYTNWLLKHHFDFMGLISKGLAIEVTESNNPYKE